MRVVKVSRRDFVKITSAASAGLVLTLQMPRARAAEDEEHAVGTFVHVGTNGIVTIYVAKSEMGQGVRTALPMIVADEMDADWKKVRIRQADLDKKYGRQGTGGSGSVRTMWSPMRQAGATARTMLVSAAATKWGVDAKECAVAKGVVTHGSKKATFGELATAASKLEVPKDIALKDPSKFTIIGKKTERLDNRDLMHGKSGYGIDVRVPGMLYGAVLRSPVFGGKVASFDDSKAKAVPGVKAIVKIDPHGAEAPWAGVGVVADSTWAALKARDALVVKWDEGEAKSETTASLMDQMRDLVTKEGKRVRNEGDADAALASAAKKIDATYELPYLAHATMEPMNATASVTADGIEIWGPTQFPDWWGGAAGGAVGFTKPEQAKVHVTLLGGGFGRRAFPDVAVEAALLSKAVGKPVKVQWTREDDMQHDFYRPATVQRVAAALDNDGKITAWHHRVASAAINSYMGRGEPHDSEMFNDEQLPLAVPNIRTEYASAKSFVPRGWWRSVENSSNAFVVQSFIDELAHAAGKDPIEFQLSLLPPGKKIERKGGSAPYPYESDRLRRVIELVREKSNWGKPLPGLGARGFAAWHSFLTYVAEVAEVSVAEDRTLKVHRVIAAIDCGTPVNPDGIAQQVEGAVVYGLSAALAGAITIKNGAVEQSNFHDYPLLTIGQMPVVEVHIVPSTALPTGTGEPGLPPTAPAVANAIFALTGKRLRKLPFQMS
ncbi:MAG TPA: xanthine dehydrogenase family protein molybdopterin-binding subunit [Thermoanaerobaculia bacterium]|nr:xanthine dehydrogenase family protein molybdopterin-binding subunit [Thermoanaerobaculia bacterium]